MGDLNVTNNKINNVLQYMDDILVDSFFIIRYINLTRELLGVG